MCFENTTSYISFMDMDFNFTRKWHFINTELFIQCAFSGFVCLFVLNFEMLWVCFYFFGEITFHALQSTCKLFTFRISSECPRHFQSCLYIYIFKNLTLLLKMVLFFLVVLVLLARLGRWSFAQNICIQIYLPGDHCFVGHHS